MNPERLLRHFDRIGDAPGAIPRLRRFILDLAVRGKLVEQDLNDEPASELLKRIQEKARLVKEGKNGNEKTLVGVKVAEEPFARPTNWQWIRLGDGLEMINGRAFKPADWQTTGLPIVRIQNLNSESALFNYCDEAQVQARHLIDSGSFLISWSGTPGTSFGAFIWKKGKAALNQHIFKCLQIGSVYFDEFLRLGINGRLDEMIAKAHGGVGLQHITKGKLENLVLPLPPLAQQHLIVAKVDELMGLCDRLEAAQAEREHRRDRLVAGSLHRLNQPAQSTEADQPNQFREHARFYFKHLPRLTSRLEHIKQLRQTILNLAVRGKLVPQDPNDEPVPELLERIQAEKAKLTQARKTIVANEAVLKAEEITFDIPGTWLWVPLQDLIVFGPQNGISPKPTMRRDAPKSITLTATTKGSFDPNHFKHVEATIPKASEFWLRAGDLLFQRGNTREYVGIAAYYSGEPGVFLYPDLMMKVRVSTEVALTYIHLAAVAPCSRAYFSAKASGAQATMPKINQGILLRLPIPLPPLAEQHRIVAKVEELMALCGQLEAHLATEHDDSRRLLEAVLHEALHPADEKEVL